MTRTIAVGVACLFASAIVHGQDAAPPEPGPGADTVPPAELVAFVDGLVEAFLRDKRLPGLTLGIVERNQPTLLRGYGYADIEAGRPVDGADTLFRIGSVSKTFIWTAVMLLVDRGVLDLDADVNGYLKTVKVADAFDAPVTMNHLMAHRAGFEDTLALFTVTDEDPRSLSELLAAHQPRRVYPPATRTSYSNWGAALAAQVVEDVAGVHYQTFLTEQILQPLGMTSTTSRAPAQMPETLRTRLATGYEYKHGAHAVGKPMQIGAYWPAGGIASTAADMARWMRFHLGGGELEGVRLLRPETHALMLSRAFNDRPEAADLAHGFQSRPYRGIHTIGHSGATALYRTQMVLAPELGLGIFASQNTGEGGYSALSAITDLILERVAGTRAASAVPTVATDDTQPAHAAQYAGRYRNNRRSFGTFAAVFSVDESMVVGAGEDGALVVTAGGQTHRYRPVAGMPGLFENGDGVRLMFQRDEAGRIVAVNDGSGVHSHERVSTLETGLTLILTIATATLLSLTTLLGTWWRWRRPAVRTAAGLLASRVAVFSALAALLFLALAIATVATMSGMNAGDLSNYPPVMMHLARAGGWLLAAMAVVDLLTLRPVWSGSGWHLGRRIHFTLFTLALAFLSLQLWQWRVIGAPLM